MTKSELISIRLKKDDITFLSGLDKDHGTTTSEKVRSIIRDRQKELSNPQYNSTMSELVLEKLIDTRKVVQSRLMESNQKSEIFDLALEIPAEFLNLLESLNNEFIDMELLSEIEKKLIAELRYLIEKYISLVLSVKPRVINSEIFKESIISLISILKIVDNKFD